MKLLGVCTRCANSTEGGSVSPNLSTYSTQLMSLYLDELTLFDRINLADCAARRAQQNTMDADRFKGEYDTARLWHKYRCIITKTYSYVDDN